MANVIIFNKKTDPQIVLQYVRDANIMDYAGRDDVLIDPENLPVVPMKYWKHDNGKIAELSQAEKEIIYPTESSNIDAQIRGMAKESFAGFNYNALFFRALVDVFKTEINILRAEHGLTPRTLDQVKTAISNKIDSGLVDEK